MDIGRRWALETFGQYGPRLRDEIADMVVREHEASLDAQEACGHRSQSVYGEFWRGILERFEAFGNLPGASLVRPGDAPYKLPVVNGVVLFPWRGTRCSARGHSVWHLGHPVCNDSTRPTARSGRPNRSRRHRAHRRGADVRIRAPGSRIRSGSWRRPPRAGRHRLLTTRSVRDRLGKCAARPRRASRVGRVPRESSAVWAHCARRSLDHRQLHGGHSPRSIPCNQANRDGQFPR